MHCTDEHGKHCAVAKPLPRAAPPRHAAATRPPRYVGNPAGVSGYGIRSAGVFGYACRIDGQNKLDRSLIFQWSEQRE